MTLPSKRRAKIGSGRRLPEKRRRKDLWVYFSSRPNLPSEVLFLFPLALIYHVGSTVNGRLNGVDLVSVGLMELSRRWPHVSMALEVAVLVGFLVLWWWAKSKQDFGWGYVGPVLAEGAVYALTMGSAIILILVKLFRMEPPSMASSGGYVGHWFDVIQISAGAGLYEEVVFRFLLFGGVTKLLVDRGGWSKWKGALVALIGSSFLFAAAHHWPGGEPFALWPFAYRTVAGMLFGTIYWYRGLSVAAYTHALYDVMVIGSMG